MINKNKKFKNEDVEIKKNRRFFLKRAIYSAPVLIGLGQLVKPAKIYATSCIPCDPEYPDVCCE